MGETILEMRGICKSFPGVDALQDVSLRLKSHQIVGLVGENGAGKSTLMKILVGFYTPDQGEVLLRGQRIAPHSVKEAGSHGIGMVFQEQALLGNITVAENIFLGKEEPFIQRGVINWRKLNQAAEDQLKKLDSHILPTARTETLDFAQRQLVEVARVVVLAESSKQTPIIVFDEPTTVCDQAEIASLFGIIRRLKESGACIVFISHRLEEVLDISDHICVLKDGRNVANMPTQETSVDQLHHLMVGHERSLEYYHESEQTPPAGDVVLSLRNCGNSAFQDVSFDLHRGEILGICGVLGSGRDELCRTIAGIIPLGKGQVLIDGKPVTLQSPLHAKSLGIGYVPVERRAEGLIQYFAVAPNITLTNPALITRGGWLRSGLEQKIALDWINRLHIKTPSPRVMTATLSGGNQQKVVLAKWLAAGVQILILDHPTRGIDVGAKEEAYILIRQLAQKGLAIVLTSDTLAETIALSNRLIVMRDGRVQSFFDAPPGRKPDEFEVVQFMC